MADNHFDSKQAVENQQSFFNVIRQTGQAQTPFFSSLKAVPFKGNPDKGHKWDYRAGPTGGEANAHEEGSKRADVSSWEATELSNQLQIFKKTSGITGSQKEAMTIEQQNNSLRDQKRANRRQLMFDMEMALLSSDAPTNIVGPNSKRLSTLGGIGHYAYIIDALSATQNYKEHIEEIFKMQFMNGVLEPRTLMVSPDQKTLLNDYLNTGKRYGGNEKTIVNNVTKIEDAGGWATNVNIITNPLMSAGTIMSYAPSLVNPVLLRAIKDRSVTDPEFDAEAYEDLFELTLQMLDPYGAILVTNLATS